MKKFLIAFACTLFTTTSFAATLTGTVIDALNSTENSAKKLKEVEVVLGNDESATTNDEGYFEIEDFEPPAVGGEQEITFDKDGYYGLTVYITTDKKGRLYFDGEPVTKEPTGNKDADNNPIYQYVLPEITMMPEPEEIIRGKIFVENEDEQEQAVNMNKFSCQMISYPTEFSDIRCEKAGNGEYHVMGYLGTEKNPRKYVVQFSYQGKTKLRKTFEVKEKVLTPDTEGGDKTKILFHESTWKALEQEQLSEMTGFGCNELMPKYLVGASCEENEELQGDATDIAMWIQRFGGKITAVVGMLAVFLIVWNAFNMVTAAGDEDKIGNAKKGIMWTIIGLALIMFAYIIVKTVIMLTYSR